MGGMNGENMSLRQMLLICVSKPLAGAGYASILVMGMESTFCEQARVDVCVCR